MRYRIVAVVVLEIGNLLFDVGGGQTGKAGVLRAAEAVDEVAIAARRIQRSVPLADGFGHRRMIVREPVWRTVRIARLLSRVLLGAAGDTQWSWVRSTARRSSDRCAAWRRGRESPGRQRWILQLLRSFHVSTRKRILTGQLARFRRRIGGKIGFHCLGGGIFNKRLWRCLMNGP